MVKVASSLFAVVAAVLITVIYGYGIVLSI